MQKRYIEPAILETLAEKMVFVGGPRQVGKTTMALHLIHSARGAKHPAYLNWDIALDRQKIQQEQFPAQEPLLVLDEVHKYARWRQVVKGFYDAFYPGKQLLVTGSARLDHYRKGGDSLLGRYRYFRLHPYSLGELHTKPTPNDTLHLLEYGGFPEPFHAANKRTLRLWQRERFQRLLQEDIASLERVQELSLLGLMIDALPARVGSPLSLQSLREDLHVSHDAIKRWLEITDNLYISFRLAPLGGEKIRAVKKEQKLYLWDWSVIKDKGARFENMVASHLLKYCHFIEDTLGIAMELRYVRDIDKREVDFAIIRDGIPEVMIECKYAPTQNVQALHYFAERLGIKKLFQVHCEASTDYVDTKTGVRVIPLHKLAQELPAVFAPFFGD
jgi:predicted AAA+ superfamily ATPase